MKKILILGVNGFIGHHLTRRILSTTDWTVYGMDTQSDRVEDFTANQRFRFCDGDITINAEWIEYHIKKCDVVLPLVAIATPADYVTRPLEVFELDFEANLPIVRACVKRGKRLVYPSSSEVYGMCPDEEFDPETSTLVMGPISKQRWIYACSKQLIDRVIWAYGAAGRLDFTLFRPFNWVGPGLDNLHAAKEGSSRVVTQFLGHIARGENIKLVDGGTQRRSFTDIEDAIDALMAIVHNAKNIASGRIYNIGNPANNFSIHELATMMLRLASEFPEWAERAAPTRIVPVSAASYYGEGYQDMMNRRPRIEATCRDLDWQPVVRMADTLRTLFDFYRTQLPRARHLIDDAAPETSAPKESTHSRRTAVAV
jgi:nucleoside-diphosphate-sugar epimerase